MKKVLLLAIVAFVLGIAGGTMGRLPKLKAARAAADSASAAAEAESLTADGSSVYGDAPTENPETAATQAYTASTIDAYGVPEAESSDGQTYGAEPARGAAMDPVDAGAYGAAEDPSSAEAGGAPVATPAPEQTPVEEPGPQYSEEGAKKLAEIFEAMAPDAAAAVLEGLEAVEIQVILQRVSSRRAAEILTAMPPELAASLSKIVLIDRGGGR